MRWRRWKRAHEFRIRRWHKSCRILVVVDWRQSGRLCGRSHTCDCITVRVKAQPYRVFHSYICLTNSCQDPSRVDCLRLRLRLRCGVWQLAMSMCCVGFLLMFDVGFFCFSAFIFSCEGVFSFSLSPTLVFSASKEQFTCCMMHDGKYNIEALLGAWTMAW